MPWALTADLVASRRIEDRLAHQERLDGCLEALAVWRPFGGWIASLERVKGIDELAGALHSPASAFALAFAVNLAVWPQRYRWALGDGAIDVMAGEASRLDGPAFWNAAQAMARARLEGLPFAVRLQGDPPRSEWAGGRLVEATADLHQVLVAGWTPKGAETVRLYRELERQDAVAERLGISQQAVSSRLAAAHWSALERAERAVGDWLTERGPIPVPGDAAGDPGPPPWRSMASPPPGKGPSTP